MHLVEVDIVGAQALQRSIDGGVNLLFAQSAAAAKMAADSDSVATANLGRQKYLPAIAPRLHPRTNVLLGSALGVRPGRHRIHFRRIDKSDALRFGVIELGVGLLLTILLAPGHRTEANCTDIDIRTSKPIQAHFY